MLTTKLLPEKSRPISVASRIKDFNRFCAGSTQKSMGLWQSLLADTVTFIPGPRLNEKIETCNLWTAGILPLIAVVGLKEFQESISQG